MLWVWCVIVLVATWIYYSGRQRRALVAQVERQFKGPTAYPIIGNGWQFFTDSAGITKLIDKYCEEFKHPFRLYLGSEVYICLHQAKDLEILLTSNDNIQKADNYRFMIPWIGDGLLTSTGKKWKQRRRIITPAFHFKILEGFVDVMNKNGDILCDKLEKATATSSVINIYPYVNLYALDNISETAMGTQLNVQLNAESAYVRAIKDFCRIVMIRAFNPLLMADFLFNLTKHRKQRDHALGVLHDTTNSVIKQRRQELINKQMSRLPEDKTDVTQDLYEKRRQAFLDILLESPEGAELSDEDIREEVDTFMFAGHDTVSSAISFTLYALATHPEVQENVYREQQEILGNSDRDPTFRDLQEMKYTERVLKEVQRLYPAAPIVGRRITQDLPLSDGVVLPKGSTALMFLRALHRDPAVFPQPDTFNPDRFLPDESTERSPFAHIPFSAGPRNCIGQRYAMIEMKSVLTKVLRRFTLHESPDKQHKVQLVYEVVIGSQNGMNIGVQPRKQSSTLHTNIT